MRAIYVSLLALALGSATFAADPPDPAPVPTPPVLDLNGPITVEIGKKIILTAQTSAKKVTWKVPAGVDTLPLDGKRLAVWAPPGTYLFVAMAPSGDDVVSSEMVLTVTGARPPPIPPPPVDALTSAAQAAYTADPSPTKAADRATMVAVFTVLASQTDAAEIRTAGNLFDFNKRTMYARLAGRLGGVGTVFATDFGTIFPAGTRESYVLTQADRDAAKLKLTTYAQILNGVK